MDASTYNPYVDCPYNRAHSVPKLRMQSHLVKCRKQHPKLASILKTCPYNATHIMPEAELKYHFRFCTERNLIEGEKYTLHTRQGELGNPSFHPPVPVGDWEDSEDENEQSYQFSQQVSIPSTSHVGDERLPGGALGPSLQPQVRGNIEVTHGGLGRGRLYSLIAQMAKQDTTQQIFN